MSGDRLDAKVEALFRRYRRDAVLLHRPYPPQEGKGGNSKFGGLPNLPDRYEWPRTSFGTPLHFLAQVDCAGIGFATPLPERGTLFFFGRDDDDQVWGFEPPASDDCRVVYALDAFAGTPPRPLPDDLPPIGGRYAGSAWRNYLREGDVGPNVHIEWPVRPLRIDSWPDPSGLPELHEQDEESGWRAVIGLKRPGEPEAPDLYDLYLEALERRQLEAWIEATGRTHELEPDRQSLEEAAAFAIFFGSGDAASDPWPQRWIYIHYLARAILHRPDMVLQWEQAAELGEAASVWLRKSLAAQLDAPVPPDERKAFRDFVAAIRGEGDVRPLSSSVVRLMRKTVTASVRHWAGSRERAALILPEIYDAMAFELGDWTPWGPQFSQMLGHPPSAQEAPHPDDPTLCLLNLASDDGIGWMFGDVGNAAFWISPQDLARRDFRNVRATVEGH